MTSEQQRIKEKVTNFFVEHPVHRFSTDRIAEYLREDPLKIAITLKELEREGVLNTLVTWSLNDFTLATEEIKDKIAREHCKHFNPGDQKCVLCKKNANANSLAILRDCVTNYKED